MIQGRSFRGQVIVLVLLMGMAAAGVWLWPRVGQGTPVTIAGVVLVNDTDPQKQVPISGAKVQISMGRSVVRGSSDENGYFHLMVIRRLLNEKATLSISHPSYEPLDQTEVQPGKLDIERLTPTPEKRPPVGSGPTLSITNAKIRYTVKEETTTNVGSLVRAFAVRNMSNEPCQEGALCSPDRKWKATSTTVTYDAGPNNVFVHIRASCVAGPCPFTRIQSSNSAGSVRQIELTVLNWSDPATYLVEAEVSRRAVSDMVREAFPAIFGTTMDFTLPSTAEGPSILADLNGTSIVFPLGPNLLLSWATCTADKGTGQTRLFRCELKPGFRFR